ncbi:MAG: PKD domain-containing protein, partial [Thermoplasmatota archaeon]
SWDWQFGDGDGAHGRQVSHLFSGPGTFDVVLSVTDDSGAYGGTHQSVVLEACPPLGLTLPAISAIVGQQTSACAVATGGHARYTYTLDDRSSNANLDRATGCLQWTPTQVGTLCLGITVTDGKSSVSDCLHVQVGPPSLDAMTTAPGMGGGGTTTTGPNLLGASDPPAIEAGPRSDASKTSSTAWWLLLAALAVATVFLFAMIARRRKRD